MYFYFIYAHANNFRIIPFTILVTYFIVSGIIAVGVHEPCRRWVRGKKALNEWLVVILEHNLKFWATFTFYFRGPALGKKEFLTNKVAQLIGVLLTYNVVVEVIPNIKFFYFN